MTPVAPYVCRYDRESMSLTSPLRLMIRGLAKFHAATNAFKRLTLRKRWFCSLFQLLDEARPIGSFDPCLQEIAALDSGKVYPVFDPTGGRGGRHYAWRAMLMDVLDESDADDDDEPDGPRDQGRLDPDEGARLRDDDPLDLFWSESEPEPDKKSDKPPPSDKKSASSSSSGSSSSSSGDTSASDSEDRDDDPNDINSNVSEEEDDERISVRVPEWHGGGKIVYFPTSNKFWALCSKHGCKCRKSRTGAAGRIKAQGRPLGALLAWLLDGDSYVSEEDHKYLLSFEQIPYETRCIAREMLAGTDGADGLFSKEGPENDNDGPSGEPRSCITYR